MLTILLSILCISRSKVILAKLIIKRKAYELIINLIEEDEN